MSASGLRDIAFDRFTCGFDICSESPLELKVVGRVYLLTPEKSPTKRRDKGSDFIVDSFDIPNSPYKRRSNE